MRFINLEAGRDCCDICGPMDNTKRWSEKGLHVKCYTKVFHCDELC